MSFKEYIEIVLKGIVDDPEKLKVELTETERNYMISVYLPASNVGQILGKRKRVKYALQNIFQSASAAQRGQAKGILIEHIQTD